MSLTTPDKIRNLQRKLYCLAKTVTCRGVVARHQQSAAGRRVPCGEASRKAGCRKSARPVVCPAKAGMFSRRQTCRGRSQSPVVWIAEAMETKTFEAYRQDLPRGGYESPGRNKSKRIVASKVSIPEGRAFNRRAKAA